MQREKRSINVDWEWLKHLLKWADACPLTKAPTIRPVYPQYLLTVRRPGGVALGSGGVSRACLYARMFFEWAKGNLAKFRKVSPVWIQTIRPDRKSTRL